MGLGLTIAKQLVELHGGAIIAESAGLDQGARFILQLPLAEVAARRPSQKRKALRTKNADRAILSGRNVLLVEDDHSTRRAIATLFRNAGTHVCEAESAAAGFESFKVSRPDLVISDIGMPDEDGYALIRRIRKFETGNGHPAVPAVALTAFARDIDRQHALDAGFQQHIAKPVEPEQVLAVVSELMQEK
jgi:CheY-like chemotaxis protein